MAKHVVTELIDDIDGTSAHETVAFGIDGVRYEIDLSAANAEKLRAALAPFIAVGRRRRRSGAAKAGRSQAQDGVPRSGGKRRSAIRAWAVAQGLSVAQHGRLPNTLVERYRAARRH